MGKNYKRNGTRQRCCFDVAGLAISRRGPHIGSAVPGKRPILVKRVKSEIAHPIALVYSFRRSSSRKMHIRGSPMLFLRPFPRMMQNYH